MLVSILMNVIDRFELTQRCVDHALAHTGYGEWELLVCDNGSKDERVIEYERGLSPAYLRLNRENRGNYQMLNQLLLRARGELFCVIDPDIMLPREWLGKLVMANVKIPESGVSGIYTVGRDKGAPITLHGVTVNKRKGAVFGTKLWSRQAFEDVGFFCEEYGPYGLGDSDYGLRMVAVGRVNYYLPGLKADHLGGDVGQNSEYRKVKDRSLKDKSHREAFKRNMRLASRGSFYVGPPETTYGNREDNHGKPSDGDSVELEAQAEHTEDYQAAA
jgi:glycosyltransferase involved in cell wall biosynthesis